jgi:hypothetical protein
MSLMVVLIMQVSSQLQSQVFSKYVIGEILFNLGRTNWTKKYNVHDLTIEAWAVGIWVKEARTIISYKVLNDYLRETSIAIGNFLSVERVSSGWLVSSQQDFSKKYFVYFSKSSGWSCNCMKFRCWRNRIPSEMPQFWQTINQKPYCHHIAAAYSFSRS